MERKIRRSARGTGRTRRRRRGRKGTSLLMPLTAGWAKMFQPASPEARDFLKTVDAGMRAIPAAQPEPRSLTPAQEAIVDLLIRGGAVLGNLKGRNRKFYEDTVRLRLGLKVVDPDPAALMTAIATEYIDRKFGF